MSTVAALWGDEKLPIKDGLYFASGTSVAAEVAASSDSGLRLLAPFDVDAFLRADPEWVTSIDITRKVQLAGGDMLCCGEGSYGSEGFFARTGPAGDLKWVIYFEDSNPFVSIEHTASHATFRTTSGVSVTVDIDDPLRPTRDSKTD